ncbi:hypothetical protein [Nostoc sp.]|uniref:hypothetical protein n=1 Tax=Nostoc sp. TaxID=1180 RepID=UPI002FFA2EB3
MEILQAIAFLSHAKVQRRKERSHCGDFAGDRSSYKGTKNYCYARLAAIALPIL